MIKSKILSLFLIFIALAIVFVIFLANVGEIKSDYAENTTFAETGEKSLGLFNLVSAFIIPLAIVVVAVIFILIIKFALSFVSKGGY